MGVSSTSMPSICSGVSVVVEVVVFFIGSVSEYKVNELSPSPYSSTLEASAAASSSAIAARTAATFLVGLRASRDLSRRAWKKLVR